MREMVRGNLTVTKLSDKIKTTDGLIFLTGDKGGY
jgi:hypothetical protein